MLFTDELFDKQTKKPSVPKCTHRLNRICNRGFSLTELIVVVAIMGILIGAAYLGVQNAKRNSMNHRMLDDIIGIANALDAYARANNGKYPIPEVGKNMNVQCFAADATYFHDCEKASFIQGAIDNSLLGVKFLQEVPTDPRTGSRYAYGVSNDGRFFQVAGVWDEGGDEYEARTVDNIHKGFNLPSLIRSYNSPNFVVDKGDILPYDPDHLNLKATLQNIIGTVKVDQSLANSGSVALEGQTVTTGSNSSVDLYFADGSVSHLDSDSELVLENLKVEENNNKNIISKVKLLLSKGKIWNKVVRLAEKSEFNVETSTAIAGVRGTQFKVEDTGTITVLSGRVAVLDKNDNHEIAEINDNDKDIVLSKPKIAAVRNGSVNIVDGDISVKQDYDTAFLKHLNNMVIPYLIKADSNTLTIETVDYQVDKIYSTLSDSPLAFTKDDYYQVSYTSSDEPQRFYFEDNLGNRSAMTFEVKLDNLSEEISFEGISDSFVRSDKARWSLSDPPDKLVYLGKPNSFTLYANALNKRSLLDSDQTITYKLIIFTPEICRNTSPEYLNGFNDSGEFEIQASKEGTCIYAVEAGVPNEFLIPESLTISFGVSPVKKVPVEERNVEDLYADFEIRTEACDSEEGTSLQNNDSFTMFEDKTFYLCGSDIIGEPEDISYRWNNNIGIIDNMEAQNTTLAIQYSEVSYNGTSMSINLFVDREEYDGIRSTDNTEIRIMLEEPEISAVAINLSSGNETVVSGDMLNISATASFENSTRTADVTEFCNWIFPEGWSDVSSNNIAVPNVESGTYSISCDLAGGIAGYRFSDDIERVFASSIEVQNEVLLVDICTSDVGKFDGEACWILGGINTATVKGESCLSACSSIGLNCVDGDWNDSGEICQSLVQTETGTAPDNGNAFAKSYAPVWVFNDSTTPVVNECRSRNTTAPVGISNASCSVETEDQYTRRICKCVSE